MVLTAAAALIPAAQLKADEFFTPGISFARVDWRAALAQLRGETAGRPAGTDYLTFPATAGSRQLNSRRTPTWMQLNALSSAVFPAIGNSPIPVLLPFDLASYASDRMAGASALSSAHYQYGFGRADLFETGPSGYDAVFTLPVDARVELPSRVFARPVEIHLTGSLLTYDVSDPLGGKGEPVKALSGLYPDLRRVIREGYVRYAFTRFGVTYVASVLCLDSVARARRLSCREASPVAEHFLKNLRIVGGRPVAPRGNIAGGRPIERPANVSPDFTYYPTGDLIPQTGYRRQPGRPDWTAYAQIRFPLKDAPAFANSQSFNNWGDCNHTGRRPMPYGKGAPYRCKVNDLPLVLDESAGHNYAYPWQDNFCETRDFSAGQCPAGYGHQGQDIRPSTCTMRNEGADRCIPDLFPTVAVRDGVLVRGKTNQAAFVLVNERNEHIRFRYMHMEPGRMDEDGVLFGRRVSEGETIGLVSNYQDYAGGTTAHLHFDIQLFTRDGWIWVNPYSTLIASYEHLLGARGRPVAIEQPVASALPETAAPTQGTAVGPPPVPAPEDP